MTKEDTKEEAKEEAKEEVKEEAKEEAKVEAKEEAKAEETKDSEAPQHEKEEEKAETKTEENGAESEESKVIKAKRDEKELTKRLQKLALERQKENKQDRLKVIQSDSSSHLVGVKSFQELNLPKHLVDAIFAMGFDRPSAIQEEALPRILANPPRNLIGQAQSGSGKTAAFTLGMLYRVVVDSPATTQAICCTPTRELAIQILEKAVKPMAQYMDGLKVQLAVAGVNVERGQKLDAHVVIGTPGKIVDWLKRKTITTKQMKVFVLDEGTYIFYEMDSQLQKVQW
jgi:ATP-dependent RNA helicase DDX19/DBP5